MSVVLSLLAGCATPAETCPTATCPTTTCPTTTCPTTPTTPTETPILDADETAALATWTPRPVTITPFAGGPSFTADRLTISAAGADLAELDWTSTTKSQDHNSSRSNKSSSVAFGDPLGGDDTNTTGTDEALLVARWDGGPACVALPCVSAGRPAGAASRLVLTPGAALDDGELSFSWGETSPVTDTFVGWLGLGAVHRYRGHVTVLKAAATDDGGVAVTSELAVATVELYLGDELVYGQPVEPGEPLATVEGITGASWPRGVVIESGAVGTTASFTW